MTLEIIRTTKLEGHLKVGEETVKVMVAEFDANGRAHRNEWINNDELYNANRKEMRKQERAFQNKVFEIEDEILASLPAADESAED
ncbi:hypothetical protein [Streptococcus danieliae]|uniref:Uncharacterized protein n=1 Tax=Streptococcus danieliae TaxID=747656 RepID=A0A7Z0S6L9_9STRE|nr:hypothetical protein [Streptococcus danieliae]MBF0699684.1 hypothetical protein [Streptococcus danieliae]NYS96860.1 hypothetical protein [Streptococcus danieliae]